MYVVQSEEYQLGDGGFIPVTPIFLPVSWIGPRLTQYGIILLQGSLLCYLGSVSYFLVHSLIDICFSSLKTVVDYFGQFTHCAHQCFHSRLTTRYLPEVVV